VGADAPDQSVRRPGPQPGALAHAAGKITASGQTAFVPAMAGAAGACMRAA